MLNFDYAFCNISGGLNITHAREVERVTCLVFHELGRIFDIAFHLIAKFCCFHLAFVLAILLLIPNCKFSVVIFFFQ